MAITEQQANRLRTLAEDIEAAVLRKAEADRKYANASSEFADYVRSLKSAKDKD